MARETRMSKALFGVDEQIFDAHLAFVIAALEPRAAELGLTGEATPAADVAGNP